MADVEPMLWQMLLPLFNNVVDVITTCLLIIESSVRLLWQVLLPIVIYLLADVIANVADGITT